MSSSLHEAMNDWMGENGWSADDDGRVTGVNMRDGTALVRLHPANLIVNQLGWEKLLNRADEPGSFTLVARLEIEAAGQTPRSDLHKLTRQTLDLYNTERRAAKAASGARAA